MLGLDVVRQAGQVRAVIGLAGQYAAVDDNLTGRENLRLIGQLTHQPRPSVAARAGELPTLGLQTAMQGVTERSAGEGAAPVLMAMSVPPGRRIGTRSTLWAGSRLPRPVQLPARSLTRRQHAR